MAPWVNGLRNTPHIETTVRMMAQHCQMSDSMLDFSGVRPDCDLAVMAPNQTQLGMTSNVLTGLDRMLSDARPEFVVVPGDTSTTLRATIVVESTRLPDDAAAYTAIAHAENPYGDGTASHAFEIFW